VEWRDWRTWDFKLLITVTCGVGLGLGLALIALRIGPNGREAALAGAILILGVVLGWLLGLWLAPYSHQEDVRFADLGKAVGALASGYLLAKLDKMVEAIFDPQVILTPLAGFRVIGFVSASLLAMIVTFAFREYMPRKMP
jgi:hypothetical protein